MIALVGCDDVEVVVDLTNVLGASEDAIGAVMKVCAAVAIERAAVAAPTNRRDPYMLMLALPSRSFLVMEFPGESGIV